MAYKDDIRKPTQKQLSDIVKDRTKAGAKTEGKVKKGEREPGKWGRTADPNSMKQAHEAQFVRNKANFVTRRSMHKESEISKMMKKGELDIGTVNKIMSQAVKNKATIIKKTTNKSRGPDEQYHY